MTTLKNFLKPNLLFIDDKATYSLQVIFASLFLALCAQIAIPLPFTPIPFSMQPLAVMLIGITLKEKKGTLAILLYLLQGCLGAPVWAGGGAGFARLLSPSGGYLMAYPLQAYFIGKCLQGSEQKIPKTLLVLFASGLMQLTLGSLWLSQFVGISNCFALGFFPFVISDAIKASTVCFLTKLKKTHTLTKKEYHNGYQNLRRI